MLDVKLGDIVTTKKKHACGTNKWEIVRVGADYKLKCLSCGRVVMLSSEDAKKAIVGKVDEKEK